MSENLLQWKRTGKITLRAEPYLIMRLPGNPPYLALYGPQCARITIGRYHTAAEAQQACQDHANTESAIATDKKSPDGIVTLGAKPGIAPGEGKVRIVSLTAQDDYHKRQGD